MNIPSNNITNTVPIEFGTKDEVSKQIYDNQPQENQFCLNCGKNLKINGQFCKKCGNAEFKWSWET